MALQALRTPPDEVDRAVAGVERAIGRLIGHLGDDDRAVLAKAAALADIGPFAVGPLASALRRVASPRHRLVIIAVLMSFGDRARGRAIAAIGAAAARDKDEFVRARAAAAVSHLIATGLAAEMAARSGHASAASAPR
ncbi:MAG TPA: hypothetical protein VGH33_22085 [Isosphaeraceae bacterium]